MNEDLQKSIDLLLSEETPSALRKASQGLSQTYFQGKSSHLVFESETMRLCYLAARMPAIYGAVSTVLLQLPAILSSWIDLGAGPGTASWAAASLFPEAKRFTLIEKNIHAIALGKKLGASQPLFEKAEWIHASLPIDLPSADAAIASYALGELDQPSSLIDRWWHAPIPLLVIVEPGTPRGFSCIRNAREQILALGGSLIAPCPHLLPCPLKESNWCHFSTRVARTRLHRYLKEASLGYEDEKYSYLIASRPPAPLNSASRILRHPQKHSGHVRLTLCTDRGVAEELSIGRSKRDLYRKARSAKWGDLW
jgi:ribosomal protein RSM22 (predicted rRNA methylase)